MFLEQDKDFDSSDSPLDGEVGSEALLGQWFLNLLLQRFYFSVRKSSITPELLTMEMLSLTYLLHKVITSEKKTQ